MPKLETVIGLEVHAQISAASKMFCACDNDSFGKTPNTTVCPVCMGHPGTLPTINESAVEKACRAAIALGCTVNDESHFDRKHYFYPDLPKGFQISQYDHPLASHGLIEFDLPGADAPSKQCRIQRLHIEEDAGKLIHVGNTTLCDYNRAGTPLMEIVTEPDLRCAEEAVAFAEELRRILIAVGASEANMFKGMMRFDASISLHECSTDTLNPRSEIKNLNSFKALRSALRYEERRMNEQWRERGGPMPHDITVGWLDDQGKTTLLREKETAEDYRYFPEPDLPPLRFSKDRISATGKSLPPLPRALGAQYRSLGLDHAHTLMLLNQPALRTRFDAIHEKTGDAKRAAGVVLTQFVGFLNAHKKTAKEGPDSDALLELIEKIDDGTISANAAKEVLEKMVETGRTASDIIKKERMQKLTDDRMLEKLAQRALDANPKAVEAYKKGKETAIGAIVGWIMKETRGQADPKKVNSILHSLLEGIT